MQYKICCSSHWQIALSLFFSEYHSVLADKLVDSGLKLTQTVTPTVNSDLLHVVVDSQLNPYVFYCMFFNVFKSKLMFLTSMIIQLWACALCKVPPSQRHSSCITRASCYLTHNYVTTSSCVDEKCMLHDIVQTISSI